MLKKIRRVLSGIIASALVITSAGCGIGKSTAYALTVDGYKVRAGIYIYYSFSAINEAKSKVKEENESISDDDDEAFKKSKLEGKDFTQWVKDKATDICVDHVQVIKHFDELGLSLTDEEKDKISQSLDNAWEQNTDNRTMLEGNGIGKESLEEIMTMSYMQNALFEYYYGDGGTEGVKEDQLKDHFKENNIRSKYIALDLHDAEGNELDADGKKELKDMANDFLKRAQDASKKSEQAMLDEFTAMQTEYDDYVADKAKAAVDEDDDSPAVTEAETGSDETVTTAAPEDEETETTTTNPYANESIIAVVTTAADDSKDSESKEKEIHYNPSEKAYKWLLDAEYGKPGIVEDDDTLYVITRLDINKRMNADDLWNENTVESVRRSMFYDKFEDIQTEWREASKVERNEKAYKRYDPFDIKSE